MVKNSDSVAVSVNTIMHVINLGNLGSMRVARRDCRLSEVIMMVGAHRGKPLNHLKPPTLDYGKPETAVLW